MGGWIGVDDKAAVIKKGWIGVDGTAREIKAGWVGVDGVAKKIWPRYVRHYHVADSQYDTNRDSDEKDSGYDTSNTVNKTYVTTSGGCYTLPWFQWTQSINTYIGTYHENCSDSVTPVSSYSTAPDENGNFSNVYVGKCNFCDQEFVYATDNISYDGTTVQVKGGHLCYRCGKASKHYDWKDTKVTGTQADYSKQPSDKVSNKKQLGYTTGCGYSWGELIEGDD